MHRLFKLKDYHVGGTVLGKKGQREYELELYAKGEKPDAIIDYPVHATDYELVDIFNWQEEAASMYIQIKRFQFLSIEYSDIFLDFCGICVFKVGSGMSMKINTIKKSDFIPIDMKSLL